MIKKLKNTSHYNIDKYYRKLKLTKVNQIHSLNSVLYYKKLKFKFKIHKTVNCLFKTKNVYTTFRNTS